eukprot:s951_g17.t1
MPDSRAILRGWKAQACAHVTPGRGSWQNGDKFIVTGKGKGKNKGKGKRSLPPPEHDAEGAEEEEPLQDDEQVELEAIPEEDEIIPAPTLPQHEQQDFLQQVPHPTALTMEPGSTSVDGLEGESESP